MSITNICKKMNEKNKFIFSVLLLWFYIILEYCKRLEPDDKQSFTLLGILSIVFGIVGIYLLAITTMIIKSDKLNLSDDFIVRIYKRHNSIIKLYFFSVTTTSLLFSFILLL